MRRHETVSSLVNPITGSRARFDTRKAPRRSVQDGEAAKGGGSDGVAAAQALSMAVRRRKSGDGSKALHGTGSRTSGAGLQLTSLCGS
jgi:hypothetical protein